MRKLKLPGRHENQPKLDEEDIKLIQREGIEGIKEQTEQLVRKKLAEQPDNDGNQIPSAGNPVYKAMHACGASSRKKLSRNHRIRAGKDLSENEIQSVVNLLVRWIVREYNFYLEEQEEKQKRLSEFAEA